MQRSSKNLSESIYKTLYLAIKKILASLIFFNEEFYWALLLLPVTLLVPKRLKVFLSKGLLGCLISYQLNYIFKGKFDMIQEIIASTQRIHDYAKGLN